MKKLFLVKWADGTASLYYGEAKNLDLRMDAEDDPSCAVCKELDGLHLTLVPGTYEVDGYTHVGIEEVGEVDSSHIEDAILDADKKKWKPVLKVSGTKNITAKMGGLEK